MIKTNFNLLKNECNIKMIAEPLYGYILADQYYISRFYLLERKRYQQVIGIGSSFKNMCLDFEEYIIQSIKRSSNVTVCFFESFGDNSGLTYEKIILRGYRYVVFQLVFTAFNGIDVYMYSRDNNKILDTSADYKFIMSQVCSDKFSADVFSSMPTLNKYFEYKKNVLDLSPADLVNESKMRLGYYPQYIFFPKRRVRHNLIQNYVKSL